MLWTLYMAPLHFMQKFVTINLSINGTNWEGIIKRATRNDANIVFF